MAGSDDDNKTRILPKGSPSGKPEHTSQNDSLWGQQEQSEQKRKLSPTEQAGVKKPAPSAPVSPSDDKTRMAPRPQRPVVADQTQVAAGKKTLTAEARARALAQKNMKQRLSAKSAEAAPVSKAGTDLDKTKFNPPSRRAPSSPKVSPAQQTSPKQTVNDDDSRTRLAPRGKAKANPAAGNDGGASAATPPNDKTQFVGRTRPGAPNRPRPAEASANIGGGEMLKNRFLLEKVLGAGGMGIVYKAKDRLKIEAQDRDPYLAIKVLSEEFRTHPEAFIALQRESRKTQRIAHPNIVNVHDFDRDGDTVFMTMEYLEGKPLDKLISQYRATGLPEDDAWKILEGICAALIYAHGEKIIHSDFKPGNIYVTDKGLAKVFDFGIARAVASAENLEESIDDRTVFDAGNLGALTPAYASLEMLEGEVPDVRDDIYALGCIAYELFTGNHPFDRVHANEVVRRGLKAKRIPGLTKRQWKAIESAIAAKREDRVESVEKFWQLLSTRKVSALRFALPTLFIALAAGFVGYQYFQNQPAGPSISEDEVRSEIEQQLRLEQHQNNLTKLISDSRFDSVWEADVWKAVQTLRELMGRQAPWLGEQETTLYSGYLAKINDAIVAEEIDQAQRLLENAPRYAEDLTALASLEEKLADVVKVLAERELAAQREQKLAQQRRQQAKVEEAVVVEKRNIFNTAMSNVDAQLQCKSSINMRDFDIAITKLRDVNISDYRKAEPKIVSGLSACIAKVGRSFPERAVEQKKLAMRIFPDNTTIANVKIIPKDPCDSSLAGLGASGKRAICRDRMPGLDKGPAMVVIPERGSMKIFAIGKYEVSVEEMNAYCTDTKQCKANTTVNVDLPVTNISQAQIRGYLAWLTEKAKRNYRLPTKVEWVYAARAQTGSLDSNRNCLLNSRGIQKGDSLIKASVGRQNKWGLVNHVGNARELVIDTGGTLVAMGGSYSTAMEECSVNFSEPHNGQADDHSGFRVLREIIER